jgi:5-methylcytosine-specific restriction endonuclease McrA
MKIWRLIAHHKASNPAIAWSIASGRIAIGWGEVGDLRDLQCASARDIRSRIKAKYATDKNAHTGGPSLWNFYEEMNAGDLVIVVGKRGRSHVVEVTGPYIWVSKVDSFDEDYLHQRAAVMTEDDPHKLWSLAGSRVAKGQGTRWTVALCFADTASVPDATVSQRYLEGTRFDIIASGRERDIKARNACIQHYGCICAVCTLDFGEMYGDIGRGFIHVHHRNPLADAEGERQVNPITDLIPLCPNCHAMVHRRNPPLELEELREYHKKTAHNTGLNRTDTALSRGPAG